MVSNTNSRFSRAPAQTKPRSRVKRPYNYKTTFDAGQIVPIYVSEVLPGDSVSVDTSLVCRMSTPLVPVMDSAWLDVYYFFCPNRLLWTHWKEFCGENNSTYWTQPTEYNVPFVTSPEGGWESGSLADYLGMPTGVDNLPVTSLYFRAYVKIFNDYFRDQNSMNPATFFDDDSDRVGMNRLDVIDQGVNDPPTQGLMTAHLGGGLLYASKFHDYFTSALPSTQKGAAAGVSVSGSQIPVVTGSNSVPTPGNVPLRFQSFDGEGTSLEDNPSFQNILLWQDGIGENSYLGNSVDSNTRWESDAGTTPDYSLVPSNLWADVSGGNVSILINDLRTAFAIQGMLELDARAGTRYQELLYSHFGTIGMDATLQRPEFLGGERIVINMSQVLQTSGTPTSSSGFDTPQGNASGFSLTQNRHHGFTKSFTEHGILMGVAVVRTNQTYQQGLDRMFSRRRKYDYYWPGLANISEQAILRQELVATGTGYDRMPFGYQEAWADYRYQPSRVTGQFRSNAPASLDVYHYAEEIDPDSAENLVISADFLWQSGDALARSLAYIPGGNNDFEQPQFLFEAQFDTDWTRVMPLYSKPVTLDRA